MELLKVLQTALHLGASDVHFASDWPPLGRIDGTICELQGMPSLTAEACKTLVYSALSDEQKADFEEHWELDCSFTVPGAARFRMNVLLQKGAVEAAVRVVPLVIPTPEALGLGPIALGLADLPRGLVLVTGPAGCGKSTTLACLIDHINRHSRKHIITIEDPIEFVFAHRTSVVRQREVGQDTHSFPEALRRVLREDPDVIMIGELRDLETISLALTAAETGHLCLATLHTIDAAQTVDRIIDIFPPHQQQQVRAQLAGVLRGVISQLLLPRQDSRGRIAARGLMLGTPAILNLIREGKTHMIANAIDTGAAAGMFSLDRSMTELARRRIVNADEVRRRCDDARTAGEREKAAL